jgi:hypothetical protein
VEAQVNIKLYQGEIHVVKLNQWWQQLNYIPLFNIGEEKRISSFSTMKLEVHA